MALSVALGGWAWNLSARLSVVETNQKFLMEQRQEVKQIVELNYKMDKRLSILENYVMNLKEEQLP
ncbi:hypothetical protein BZG05_12995 [Salinivibrio kushneri]|nr:hypothetical protein BZG05_12995 [Salinivibrio kushneri]